MPDLVVPPHLRGAALAVLELVRASTWGETHNLLVRDQRLLLTDAGEEAVRLLMRQAELETSDEKDDLLRTIEMHQALIHDARVYGIERAWRALEAFLRLSNAIPPSRMLAPPGR